MWPLGSPRVILSRDDVGGAFLDKTSLAFYKNNVSGQKLLQFQNEITPLTEMQPVASIIVTIQMILLMTGNSVLLQTLCTFCCMYLCVILLFIPLTTKVKR